MEIVEVEAVHEAVEKVAVGARPKNTPANSRTPFRTRLDLPLLYSVPAAGCRVLHDSCHKTRKVCGVEGPARKSQASRGP